VSPSTAARALLAVPLAAALAACGTGAADDAAPARTGPPPQPRLEHVVLTGDDIAGDYQVVPFAAGDGLESDPTLENCGYRFTTERHRVARRQVAVLRTSGHGIGLSHEVVAYATTEQAERALAEFRDSVIGCPEGRWHRQAVAGASAVRHLNPRLASDAALPVKDNAVQYATMVPRGTKRRVHGYAVLQREGTVLSAVRFTARHAITAGERAYVTRLARLTGRRLAGL
jgi:hypothetical protein